MRNKYLVGYVISIALSLPQIVNASENTEQLTIYQVMQRVIDRYPSLKISQLQVEQASEQRQQVESSLGWSLNSSSGITHDLTALGTPSDKLDVKGSLARRLKSGSQLSLNGGYRFEDSSLSFNPSLPNPAHTTSLDVSYRIPLLQGDGNPLYAEGVITADASHNLAKANQLSNQIALAENVKNIFYALALTEARLRNAQQAVKRTKKLKVFVNKNAKLGLSEKKDQLQIQAQLDSSFAELSVIKIQKNQQQTALNRLMRANWSNNIKVRLATNKKQTNKNTIDVIALTKKYHPSLKLSKAKLAIANSQIESARDSNKDNFDFVISVGSRTSNGESETSTVSEQDWAGSVGLEYKHLFDERGGNAKYKQAILEKTIAEQNIQLVTDDIHYNVSGLLAEIRSAKLATEAAAKKLKSESAKLKEAEYRFRSGRANTAQLIQFQNEYSFAQLSYQNQKVDLNNRMVALEIYSGKFWHKLDMKSAQKGVAK